MKTFSYLSFLQGDIPRSCWDLLALVYEDKGKMDVVRQTHSALLSSMEEQAFFDNVDASTRIEGVYLGADRTKEIIAHAEALNDQERQVAGYARCLRAVIAQSEKFELTTSTLLALHEVLFSGRPASRKSRYRRKDYATMIIDGAPQRVPVSPITAFETPLYLGAACDDLREAFEKAGGRQLLLIPVFCVDFLCIRPFDEGNGRLSRLFANLMLEKAGFDIVRYMSIDRICEADAMSYYNALNACTARWDEGGNDYIPFVEYWLNAVHEAYSALFAKTGYSERGALSKADRIARYFELHGGDITKREVAEAHPDISLSTIENALADLVRRGEICKKGSGRSTCYCRSERP